MKNFKEDLFKLLSLLQSKVPFAFSKYADGEYAMLRNLPITNCDNWTFNPRKHSKHHKELLRSFQYNEPGYFVGISCPCCAPAEDVAWMRENVGADSDHLTWANLFVNGNYEDFVRHYIPEFINHEVVVVATKEGNPQRLPFDVSKYIGITGTAWKDNFNLIKKLPLRGNGKLYLLCAGPLGNMLAGRMWKKNKNNIYMDIGSTLNPWLVGKNRGYLRGGSTLEKMCVW